MRPRLLTLPGSNPKTNKSFEMNFYNPILHLAPYTTSGKGNVCPASSRHCRCLCLHHCGHGGIISKEFNINDVIRARVQKTRTYFTDKNFFMQELDLDMSLVARSAKKAGLKLAVRLNGTSDIAFESISFEDRFGDKHESIIKKWGSVIFYDYTKLPSRIFNDDRPLNLHFTLSYSGANEKACRSALRHGTNVAVIFKRDMPDSFWGAKVIDGDVHDLRFLDEFSGVVIGLKAKGLARTVDSKAVIS